MNSQEKKILAEKLDNSRPLNIHRHSTSRELDALVDKVYEKMKELDDFKGSPSIQKRNLRALLLDLHAAQLHDSEMYISLYRMKGKYKGRSRYNLQSVSYTLVSVVDSLVKLGYLELHKGYYARTGGGQSKVSRMKPTAPLNALLRQALGEVATELRPETECIILRARDPKNPKKKIDIDYQDTPEIIKMRKDLDDYNNLIRRTHIDIPLFPEDEVCSSSSGKAVKIDRTRRFTRRVFSNGSFEEGGRFYGGWWQQMPKKWRERIRINGDLTVEIDYSGLHIVLLYALEGVDYWKEITKDPYVLDGYEVSERMRKLLKLILLVAINAETKAKALGAIREAIRENPDEYAWIKDESIDLSEVIDAFAKKHKQIAKYLFSGTGIKLQHIDSDIAAGVMKEMTSQEIPILPVHDSFLVSVHTTNELEKAMDEQFKRVLSKIPGTPDNITALSKISSLVISRKLPEKEELEQVTRITEDLEDKKFQERLEKHKNMSFEKDYYRH